MTVTEATDVLLVGGGVASVRCARALRRNRFDGPILMVGAEPTLPYNRPPLSKELLREDLADDLVLAEPEGWYVRRSIDLRLGTAVTALDVGARVATLADGARVRFDRCLLATGAEPRPLPVPGAERALTLRTLEDAHRLRSRAAAGSRAVIVGGGFIGVELAASLAARGVDATVVELSDQLWGGVLGPELSAWALDRLEQAGVRVLTGTAAEAVESAGARVAGRLLAADFVIVGVGVAPRDGLARDAGLEVDDGITADGRHETRAAGIFTAGDVARIDGRRVEHWHAARDGGERAAMAMLDMELPAPRTPWVFTEVAGWQLDVVGWAPAWDEVRRIGSGDRFALAYLVDGRVEQVAIVDSALPVEEARGLVERDAALEEFGALLRG